MVGEEKRVRRKEKEAGRVSSRRRWRGERGRERGEEEQGSIPDGEADGEAGVAGCGRRVGG